MALTPLGQAYQSYLKNNQGTPGNNTAQVASQTQVPTPGATGSGIATAYGAAPKPYVPPNTNTAPKPGMGTQIPANAATSPKVPIPSTGYGGATYGSSGAVNDALEANAQYIKDPNNRQSEIDRALAAIQTRQAQGLDTSAQTKYLTSLGYNPEQRNDTSGTPVPTPGTGTGPFTAPDPSNTSQIPTYNPAVPVMDEAAIRAYAEKQVARKLADARLTADQSIANNQLTAKQQSDALKSNYDKMYADITENRNVENVDNTRRLSPFSGRSDYAQGMIEQNRARTDRENQNTLQTNQGNIAAQSAQLQQQINDKYTALSNAAPDEREALFQSIKNDERQYDLMVHGTLRDDQLANSQLNNTAFNQALQQFQTNYQVGQDQIQNDAQYGGTYNNKPTYAAQQQQIQNDAQYGGTYGGNKTAAQSQQEWENRFNYGNAIGQFGNGQQTLESQQQQTSNQQWQKTFDRAKYESDRDYQHQKQQESIANGQWQQTFNQDVEKFGFQKASELWSQAFQQNQANQDDDYRNQQLQQNISEADRGAASQATGDIVKSGLVSVTTDPISGQQSVSVPNPQNLNDYIKALHLSDDATDALLYQFGLNSFVKK